MSRFNNVFLPLALALPFAVSAAPVSDAASALQSIAAAGHYAPYELEFRYGHWTAEATTAAGQRVDILVDANTGEVKVFDSRGTGAIPAQRVRELVLAAGYVRVKEVEFDDGFWEVEAIDGHGREVDLVLNPLTGAILGSSTDAVPGGSGTPLTAEQVRAALTAVGYTAIRDLEYDDGHWEADAVNARGQRVELKIDSHTGAVLREKLDD